MAKILPPGKRIEFSIDPSLITGYELVQFRYDDGTVGERLEITYFGRNNVKIVEDESLPHGMAIFQATTPARSVAKQWMNGYNETFPIKIGDHVMGDGTIKP